MQGILLSFIQKVPMLQLGIVPIESNLGMENQRETLMFTPMFPAYTELKND